MFNFIYKYVCYVILQIQIYFGIMPIIQSTLTKIYSGFDFHVYKISNTSNARRGIIYTPHGKIQTPAFIFCATKGSMKSTTIPDVIRNKTQIILSNTYHLFLKGVDTIKKLGGLHKALGFNKPMLTDSGGYQVFAMNFMNVSKDIKGSRNKTYKPTLVKIDDNNAKFRSYYTKELITLDAETSIQTQMDLGADIILAYDECTSSKITKNETLVSTLRSHNWEERSINYFITNKEKNPHKQALYGIVQGGVYKEFRKLSCDFINSKPFFGIAVGGCLGENTNEMYETVNYTMLNLTRDRPVHLLGIGYIRDIFNGVRQGIDTFDCVHPTRVGRHGYAFIPASKQITKQEKEKCFIDISKSKFSNIHTPIFENCKCTTCSTYKLSYLHCLIKMKETVVYQLITNHNIYFMNTLMEDIRNGIEQDNLESVEKKYIQ